MLIRKVVYDILDECVYFQVRKILNKYGAYTYRQKLVLQDKERRFSFCNFNLNKKK